MKILIYSSDINWGFAEFYLHILESLNNQKTFEVYYVDKQPTMLLICLSKFMYIYKEQITLSIILFIYF